MSILSVVWGILALIGLLVGLLPCLGSLNWLNIPFAAIGLVVSIIAISRAPANRKGSAIAGVVLCAIAAAVGLIRLIAGGGLI